MIMKEKMSGGGKERWTHEEGETGKEEEENTY